MKSRSTSCYVYFLRPVGEDGPVKIGYSVYPADRLTTYLKWSPLILEIAAKIEFEGEGCHQRAMRLERQLHQRYAGHHMHHEWFATHPMLRRDLELIVRGKFQASRLPEPVKTIITLYANSHARTRGSHMRSPTQRMQRQRRVPDTR